MLPVGDKTPQDWVLPASSSLEKLKRLIRAVIYPAYLRLINSVLKRRFDLDNRFKVDQWYWGHRGLEYELLRAGLDNITGLRGKNVLIAGCGTGRDIPSWLKYSPHKIIGVDYFSYSRAWAALTHEYSSSAHMEFVQGDLARLSQIPDSSIDVIGSDAVFEHLKNLPDVLREFYRVLKKDGVIYATFGPLWYSWGGDHISGSDEIQHGYNHLLLPEQEYKQYLAAFGQFAHSEHDGRTWVAHGLFSYLRPQEYLSMLAAAGFKKIHLGMVIEPRAVRCLQGHPDIRQHIQGAEDLDLLVTGMTLVYRKSMA